MTIKMRSLKRHPWDGGFKLAADNFPAEDETQAKTVEALGWAVRDEASVEQAPAPQKPDQEAKAQTTEDGEKPKRKYTRRDMRAE